MLDLGFGGCLLVELVDECGHTGYTPLVVGMDDERIDVALIEIHEGGGGGLDGDAGQLTGLPWECRHAEQRPVIEEQPALNEVVAVGFLGAANCFNRRAIVGRAGHDCFDASIAECFAGTREARLHTSVGLVAD